MPALAHPAPDQQPATQSPAVALERVSVRYAERVVLDNITFEVPEGRVVGVIGPNGAGKSTLLKAIAGLLPLAGGRISVLGSSIEARRGLVAYVPQRTAVDLSFPITALEVVLMGRLGRGAWLRRPSAADRAAAHAALATVETAHLTDRPLGDLSGGEQQRVVLARALAQDARLLLLDEPLTGVDESTQAVVYRVLAAEAGRGRTILVATHDLESITEQSHCLACLNRRLVAFGAPRETNTPEVIALTFGGRADLRAHHHHAAGQRE
jgi:ABC-type Mn2+/Zn2+ transport system ATPase subunit